MLKKLALGASISIVCFIVAINLSTIMNFYPGNIQLINYHSVESRKPIIHDFSNIRSDVYDINGDVRIHGNSSTIFVASDQKKNWTIKPYAQRLVTIMRSITEFTIKTDAPDQIPNCARNLSDIPAIVFSGRAHANNHFHAFADILFPLFLTSNQFNGNVIFLVTYQFPPWLSTYEPILKKLSRYDVVNIDEGHEVLCFTRMIVGLKSPIDLFISPNESASAFFGSFAKFVRRVFSLPLNYRVARRKPRMLIISRNHNRKLINEHEMCHVARGLGFDVSLTQLTWNLTSTAELVNTFDVMVGVHGAGLTNMIFLPENAILVQITPFGVDVEARICFEWAGELMNLRYLEYKVSLNESSLLGKYPVDSVFYKDPEAVKNRSYGEFHAVYLDSQNLHLDLNRFKKTLLRALEILHI